MRCLTAIPVYNEAKYLVDVLAEVRRFSADILVVDDGSADDTPKLLDTQTGLLRIRHELNRGYGAALQSAFCYAVKHRYDVLVTMDCDGQHEPSRLPMMLESVWDCDIVSGSRYLRDFRQNTPVPPERHHINQVVTSELNERFSLNLTDAFCGFKSYRVSALAKLHITEAGWGMPLQLWVQAAKLGLRIREVGVPRIYLDPKRAFGGIMNDADARLAYYRGVIDRTEIEFSDPARSPCGELCS